MFRAQTSHLMLGTRDVDPLELIRLEASCAYDPECDADDRVGHFAIEAALRIVGPVMGGQVASRLRRSFALWGAHPALRTSLSGGWNGYVDLTICHSS